MNELETKTKKLFTDVMTDEGLRKELRADPIAVFLRETGIQLDPDREIKVLEETKDVGYLIMPYIPPEEALSEEELDMVTGGGGLSIAQSQDLGASRLKRIDRMRANIEAHVPVNAAITDSAFCYSAFGGGCSIWGCDP